MTLELPPDGAHGMAAHVTGEEPERLEEDEAKRYPARPAALRAEEHQPAAPLLDHAAIRTMIAGIMLALFLSALEQTIVAPALPAIGRSLGQLATCPGWSLPISWQRRRRHRSSASSPTSTAGARFCCCPSASYS